MSLQQALICQHNDCRRGVYIHLPPRGQSSYCSYWYCYAGHEQDPNQLTYAQLNQIDVSVPDDAKHWSEHPTLHFAFAALQDFCLQIGFDQDELDESDWRVFSGDRQPSWMSTGPCHEEPEAWREHREKYETYHVFIGGRAFFFWIRNDVNIDTAAYATEFSLRDLYFWQEDDGERRNTDIFIVRDGARRILHRIESTRPGALQARLSSAYAILRSDPLSDRIEIHENTFDPVSLYEGKPLAAITRDDLRE
jgi:hypothetical protein